VRAIPRLLATTLLALSPLACAGAPAAPPPAEPAGTPVAPVETPAEAAAPPGAPAVALLEARLALATGDGFYLILDPAASELTLLYGGAVLQTWPVGQIAIGRPRAVFARVSTDFAWHSVAWTGGVLAPARPVQEQQIEPPGPDEVDSDVTAVVPPTAEEAIPVPSRYQIRFREGLALDVRKAGDASGWWARQRTAVAARWQDVGAVLRSSTRDTLRVRVTLEAPEADALYRALPPDTSLLVLPPPDQ
jgi:hypothetical protein